MDSQIKELDGRILAKVNELNTSHLTDLGKLIKTRELTELLQEQNELLKQKLERTKRNGKN